MASPDDLKVITIAQEDPRLGRNVVHDPRSRRFAFPATETPRRDITLRVYNPRPNPEQTVGCCTGVDAVVKCNAVGNRVKGRVLGMDDALEVYSRATQLDPWPGSWPPEDTGSSGLAACQASVEFGLISSYSWIFSGTAGIYAALTQGKPVGVGTWWLENMFEIDHMSGLIDCSGPRVGGHQFTIVGYRKKLDAFIGMCWWGPSWGMDSQGRFLIRRASLQDLLSDDGDAHVTSRRLVQ